MDILKEMVHANIPPLYEIIDDPNSDKIYLMMQYLNAGSLEDSINESIKLNVAIPKEAILSHFRQLVSALHYCHEVKFVAHRGVKPSNMMLEFTSGKLKVCGFGLSQFFQCRSEKLEDSKLIKAKHQGIRFIPPELIEDYL